MHNILTIYNDYGIRYIHMEVMYTTIKHNIINTYLMHLKYKIT